MSSSLTEMIAQINKNALAKPTRYEIRIFKNGAEDQNARDVFYNCSAVQVPGINWEFYQERRYTIGLTYPVLENKTFSQIMLTFYETEFEKERKYFVDWGNEYINNASLRVKYYKDYVRNVEILQYNNRDEMVYKATLFQCSITNISQLDRGYDMMDTIPEFNVNLQFQDMREQYYQRNSGETF